jgi:hypothetical protein
LLNRSVDAIGELYAICVGWLVVGCVSFIEMLLDPSQSYASVCRHLRDSPVIKPYGWTKEASKGNRHRNVISGMELNGSVGFCSTCEVSELVKTVYSNPKQPLLSPPQQHPTMWKLQSDLRPKLLGASTN